MENMKDQKNDPKKIKASNSNYKKNKSLPWWVELLFVQIGLPDKLLIKILKSKKKFKELLKRDKKLLLYFFLFFGILTYFYPTIKYSKSKLNCESTAQNYIIQNKKSIEINKRKLKMLSTNFCNGGDEIYKIKNLEN